jgi:hypothetical protein
MHSFARFLMNAFGEIAKALSLLVGKKVAVAGAAVSVSLALLLAFFAAAKLLVAGIVYQISNEYVLMSFYLFWPSNAELCISAYWSARLSLFLYREYRTNLRLAAYVT